MRAIISKFKDKRILVIGDLILDQYIQGSVSRISQEAPVPIVLQEGDETFTPGGAANVADNLINLGARVSICGQIGKDAEGKILVRELKRQKINTEGVLVNNKIPTSIKTRILAQHQQVLRVDREKVSFKSEESIENRIIAYVNKNIKMVDALIISDYGKGVVTPVLVNRITQLAKKNRKIITVDPKEDHFEYYKGVTAITPNKKEALNAITNIALKSSSFKVSTSKMDTEKDFVSVGNKLLKHLKLDCLLLTLGEDGMRLFEKGKSRPYVIKTQAKEVFDVTGAGDTVIAVFTLALTAQCGLKEAAQLSNIAAGIVVGKMGAVAVQKQELCDILQGAAT